MNKININKLKKDMENFKTVLVEDWLISDDVTLTVCNFSQEMLMFNYHSKRDNKSFNVKHSYLVLASEIALYETIAKDFSAYFGDKAIKEVAAEIIED